MANLLLLKGYALSEKKRSDFQVWFRTPLVVGQELREGHVDEVARSGERAGAGAQRSSGLLSSCPQTSYATDKVGVC